MAKPKVLVIDDEYPCVLLIETNLKLSGYEVSSAINGSQGLEKAKSEQPNLIILDVNLPDIKGWEVYETLKQQTETKHIPVIFVTGYAQDTAIIKGLDMGAVKYVTKPFDPVELVKTVKELLN